MSNNSNVLLTPDETLQLVSLLSKATGASSGAHRVIVSPTVYAPDDFVPRKRVCIGSINNVVGETEVGVEETAVLIDLP